MAIQSVQGMKWYPTLSSEFGVANSSIAANSSGVVEIWSDGVNLSHRVGLFQWGTGEIQWGAIQSHGYGTTPSIALNDNNLVVEVHQSQNHDSLWIYAGTVDFNAMSINWSYSPSGSFTSGIQPAVALNANGQFIEVHQTQGAGDGLWGHLGTFDGGSSLNMVSIGNYDSGSHPSVAVNSSGSVVEVHETSNITSNALEARIGYVTDWSKGKLDWSGGHQYDSGILPSVALNDGGELIEVHQAQGPGSVALWYWLATPDFQGQNLNATLHDCLSWGAAPSVGLSSRGWVAFNCQDGDNSGDTTLYEGIGQLAQLTYGLAPEWLSQPYNTVVFPGTHNTYSNDSPNTESYLPYHDLNLNNHLSVTEQLEAGIRCLDFEVHPSSWVLPPASGAVTYDAIVYHGSGSAAPLEAQAGCSSLQTLFEKVAAWVASNPSEIVTVYCDYQGGFSNDGTVIQVLKDAGLFSSVYNLNNPMGTWPTLQAMIDAGQTVMVFGLQSTGGADFPVGQNSYDAPGDNCQHPQPTWGAPLVSDLSPDCLCLTQSDLSAPLFRDSNICSRRSLNDAPWSTAGNPYQAAQANTYYVVYDLASAIISQRSAAQAGNTVNWIWTEFVASQPYGFLAAVYDLNQAALGSPRPLARSPGILESSKV